MYEHLSNKDSILHTISPCVFAPYVCDYYITKIYYFSKKSHKMSKKIIV